MKLLKTIALMLVFVPGLVTVQAKTKKPYKLPAMFNQAQYVWVEAVDGQEFDPWLIPEDRQAIGDVYNALYDWHRYVITTQRDQADLIFVVRKGRLAQTDVGVQAGTGPLGAPGRPAGRPGLGTGVSVGGEVGPPDDLLEVYMPNPKEARGTLLWQRTLADGLSSPDVPLFKQLKDEVERTYPVKTASKSKKP
jgi:hypothetical protein